MYRFIFQREISGGTEEIEFPLAPSQFKTKVGNKNKTVELVSVGEVNIIKNIGLRDFSFKLLLPKDDTLITGYKNYVDDNGDVIYKSEYFKMVYHEPIWYLNRLRELKADSKPFFLVIIRQLIDSYNNDGSINYKYLFGGNLKVTLEEYTVEENAGEEGDYWVDIKLKEYRQVGVIKKIDETGEYNDVGVIQATEKKQREQIGNIPLTYTVKSEDETLWTIAKKFFDDGSKWNELAKRNSIQNPNSLEVGRIIYLRDEIIATEPTIGQSFTAEPGGISAPVGNVYKVGG